MTLPLEAIQVPLHEDGHGGYRVGMTTVQLDRLLAARQQGATAEDVVAMYPALDLADVHAVLSWMLRHPNEVEDYRRRREEQAQDVRRCLEEAGHTARPGELRAKLEARQAARGQGNAARAD